MAKTSINMEVTSKLFVTPRSIATKSQRNLGKPNSQLDFPSK